MTRKSSLAAAFLSLTLTSSVLACLWDRDTIETEKRQYPGVLELITGKFVRHSPDYYAWRVHDREQRMKYEEPTPELFDDLAVGYEKLGNHDKAIALMLEKEKQFPGLYETRANLGTFYIHDGQLERGLKEIELAIEINPGAHFGREIYQKHLVKYVLSKQTNGKTTLPLDRSDRSKMKSAYGFAHYILKVENVTGSGIHKTLSLQKSQKGVMGMMRFGNYDSPILLEALGDLLMGSGSATDGNRLAARAYLKASYGAKDEKARKAYRKLADDQLVGQIDNPGDGKILTLAKVEESFKDEVAQGSGWFENLKRNEQKWIAEGGDVDKSFDETYFKEPEPIAHPPFKFNRTETIKATPVSDWNGAVTFLVTLLAVLIATVVVGMYAYLKDQGRLQQDEPLDGQGNRD